MSFPSSYNSIQFTRTLNNYIDCTTNAILAVGETAGSQMSYSAWINIPSNPAASIGICSKSSAAGTGVLPWVDTSGNLRCDFIFNTHATVNKNTNHNVSDGKWHHIVVTNNATGNSNIYCDGVLLTSDANGDFLKSSATFSFRIGHTYQANPFNGSIADCRVFGIELLLSEVQNLLNGIEVSRGLVCRWPFREGGGTTTTDTCNGVVGTINNGPTWAPNVPILPSVYVPPATQPPTASQTGPRNQYYCWVTTWNTPPNSGTVDVQAYISHEILELMTDPDANTNASGWISSVFCPTGAAACELADQCEKTTGVGNYTSLVNGINCWSTSYYSNKGGGCVIPEIVSSTASGNQNFTWGGGQLIASPTICVIFSGSGWSLTNTASPAQGSADDIKRGIQTLILNTSFYDGLREYNVAKPTFQYAAINSTTVVPNPFYEQHIQQVIKDCITAGTVPNPAALSDTLIFVVVVNATPHYFNNSVIGNHSVFQFTPPPPTNTPTANAPGSGQSGVGPTSPSLQGDQWDITMIYPSKTTGNFSSAWFLPTNPNSDTRHVVDSTTFTANADGSYRNTQTNVVYNIAQQNGFNEAGLTLNQATLLTQGFMQDNKDWDNTEMTLYVRINSVANSSHTGPPSIVMAMPGARETNDATLLAGFPKSCEASDYRMYIEPVSGIIKFQKDLQFTAGITANASNPTATSPTVGLTKWSNQFTGLKFITYEMSDGVSVALELWMDYNGNNIWTQVLRFVDVVNSTWSIPTNACGGTTNQTIPWGGPLVKFIWNNISSIDIKWASVREIDVYALNPKLLVPPAVSQPTQPPTTSPANNLPANPAPPNQAPPANPQTGNLDKFGVKMLFPSLSGGQSWYLSNRGLKGDSRVIGIPNSVKEYVNGDGSFHMTGTSALFYVTTLAGYNYQSAGGLSLNHALCRVRQYMQSPRDWKNVEVTIYHMIDMFDPVQYSPRTKTYDLGIKCRTGSHSRVRDCQGCAYEIQAQLFPGAEKFFHRKEHWHDCHADTDRQGITFSFSSVMRRMVGQKFVAFNIVDQSTGRVTAVRLQHWWNDNGDGVTWTKVNETVDNGNWGMLDGQCGGNRDEIIIWGGPLIGFFWNDFTGVCYKWMSIREIDTTGNTGGTVCPNPPGGPPSTSPPAGPPPQPAKIAPLIGPNVYNVFKFPYNIQLDDSGGCPGLDPLAHLGETELGAAVPGTGNFASLGTVSGSQAFVAGQQIKNTSSLLYNTVMAEIVVSLKLVGLPSDYATQPIYCTIRRGYDNLKVVDFGNIPPNQLTSQFQLYSFKTPSLPNWSTTNGDILALEYYGGNASNYVEIQYDTTSGYDGANSAFVYALAGSTTVNTVSGSDTAGSLWGTGQAGVQPTLLYNVPFTSFSFSAGVGILPIPLGYGGAIMASQQIIGAGSVLIGKTIYEIDIWVQCPSPNNLTGMLHVFIYDNNSGTIKADFGSYPASKLIPPASGQMQLVPFFCYSNTWVNALNTWIIVEYKGDDAATAGVSIAANLTGSGGPFDSTNSLVYTSTDSKTWNLLYQGPQFGGPTNGSTGDLCALMWNSTTPPVGGQPPVPGGNIISIGNTLLANAPSVAFLGGLVGFQYMAAGILIQDSQSHLIGKIPRGIDVSLAQISNRPDPTGQGNQGGTVAGILQVTVHHADGTAVGSSATYDVSKLSFPLYSQVRFNFTLTNPANYRLQVGDRILVWFGQSISAPVNKYTQPGVGLALTRDAYDGAHTIAVTFGPVTGVSSASKWGGFVGNWTSYPGLDLVCNIYYSS